MLNPIYENTSLIASTCSPPVPQYDYHRRYPRTCVPCNPPEAAWKSYEIQELYDELNKLRCRDEAHTKARQEIEEKWKESQEEIRILKGEVKLLKEEKSVLLSRVYSLPPDSLPIPAHNPTEGNINWVCRVRSKNSVPLARVQSINEIESQKMKDDIKSLNLIIQHLTQEGTKADEECKQLQDHKRRQEGKLNELTRINEGFTKEVVRLNCKVMNCQNENASLTLIVAENLPRLKL